jgi:hypothetical protein
MTVLVAIHKLPASVLTEAREACRTLGLATADWTGGTPRGAPYAVISGLDHGVRRIPEDLMALLDARPGLPVLLCAQEPLVKPRVVVGDGRVAVLAPPIGRTDIIAALRAALEPAPPMPLEGQSNRRFEVLRRSHWIAWTRGRLGPAISLHEQRGATVILGGSAQDHAAIADLMTSSQSDDDRESALSVIAGKACVAHLTHDANEWMLYWPREHSPLWLYSPNRVPMRWNAARGIAAVADRRLLRLPAFPADQLVAAWSEPAITDDAFARVHQLAAEGGSQTIVALDELASRDAQVTGLVMEVR